MMELNKTDEARLNFILTKMKNAPNIVQEALQDFAIDSVEEMKQIAPVDTGNLRNNIRHDIERGAVVIESNAPYSGYVEHGTRYQHAQPYFWKTIRKHLRQIANDIKSRLRI